jgi:DNA-binding CsgD family transcriptional regulator
VGKTRLANELVLRHRDEVVGLLARAYPLGGTASFGLWSESLDRHLRAVAPHDILRLCGGFIDDLAGLLRSVAAVRGSVPQGDVPRHRLLEGLAVVFSNLAAESPVVVVLDDVHLADASSWEALQYLASNLPESRLLVVAAARPVELAEHEIASRILFGLEQEGFLTRLDLRPLDTDALSELTQAVVGQAPPPTLVAWLNERCRGNPLFAIGLLRALDEEGADLVSPRLRRLPEALAERVEERLRRLDDSTRSTLELIAVLGRRVELGELAAMSSLPLGQLASVLEFVVRNGLLSEEERGVELTYEMSHPLIQEAVYQAIGTARRRVLHRQVARALLAAGRPGEAAPHFARSAEVGDSEAVEALHDALAEAERRGAYREALGVLGSLVELLPAGDERWLEVADAISWDAEWVIDHRADRYAELAVGALRAIDAALGPDAAPALRAGVQFRLASFLGWGTGDVEAAQLAAREAAALFEAAGDRQRALVAELEHGLLLMMGGDTRVALATGWQVVARAEAAGDDFVLMQAFGRSIGLPALMLGRLDESEDALQRSTVLAEASGRRYFKTMAEMFLSLNGAVRGRLDDAFRHMAQAKSNPEWRETLFLESQCLVHWIAGDLGAALAAADESLTWNAGRLGRRRAWGLAYAVVSAVEAERLDDARRYLSPVLGSYGGRRWAGFSGLGDWAGAMISWQEQGPAAALDPLRAAASDVLEVDFVTLGAPILADVAEAAAACDRADLTREAAGRLGEIAGQVDSDFCQGLAALASAYAELVTGAAKPTAAAARRAAETFARTGCRLFSGRALDLLGRAVTNSDRAGAVQAFEEAASIFGGSGATWRRNRTIDALAQLGSRGRRAAGAVLGPASLTGRERQVARLAAQGLTVRQIGERLFIGERTVESHLARAYAKLGVSSKADLVARASGLGL